jgi:hypothetical protein
MPTHQETNLLVPALVLSRVSLMSREVRTWMRTRQRRHLAAGQVIFSKDKSPLLSVKEKNDNPVPIWRVTQDQYLVNGSSSRQPQLGSSPTILEGC